MFRNDLKIKIASGSSRKAEAWHIQDLYWSEFVAKLQAPVRTPETLASYKALTKAKQDDLKDVGGFVGGELKGERRKNENAGRRYLLTLDADNIAPGATQAVINAVDSLGCAYVVYSTRKHEESAPRLRIIVPLDAPAEPDEYEPIARKLASCIGMALFDPTTFEVIRLMYWPSCSIDSSYVFIYADKPFLSKEGMLQQYQNWRDVTQWPEVPGAGKLRERSAKKQGDPLDKRGAVGAFCKTYSIEEAIDKFLPDVYEPCDTAPDRYTYAEGSTVGGAVLYDNGKFLYSHHATDPAGGKLCNAFDLVRLHLFSDADADAKPDTPVTNLPSFKAMCEFAVKDEAVSKLMAVERYEMAKQELQDNSGRLLPEEDPDWMQKLKVSSQTGLPVKTIDNVVIILSNDPALKGHFYHDEFANRCVKAQPLPWDTAPNFRRPVPWADEDDSGLRHYIEKMYTITGKERIYDAMAVCATSNKQNKLREYLESLKWDGVSRLDTLLVDYFGAPNDDYTRMAMRKTLTAAVARVFVPGTKFDSMLILSGPQGVGKSTFFRILGKDWYSDSLTTFEGKDAAELIQGYWIIEAGELTGLNKSEMNTVKQFLSKTEDVYRVPYGRRTAAFPRSCIIVGTTNDTEFLKDRTGNRRFWPVDLSERKGHKDVFRQLPLEVDQIWAEAVVRYQMGESLYMTGEAAQEALAQQERHKESSPREGIILEFLARKVPADWNRKDLESRREFLMFGYKTFDENLLVQRDRICAAEIWCECFGGDLKLMRRTDAIEINGILGTIEGWERATGALKFGSYYGPQKGFLRKPNP